MKDKIVEIARNMPWEQMVQNTRADSIVTLYVGILLCITGIAVFDFSAWIKDEEDQFIIRTLSIIPLLIGIALMLIQINILNNPEYYLYTQIMNVLR